VRRASDIGYVLYGVGRSIGPGMTIFSPDGKYGYVRSPFTPETDARPPFTLLMTLDTGPITNHVNIARNANGMFAYVTVGGLNEVKAYRTDNFQQVATIPVGRLPHGIWPSGDGTRVYVGLENEDRIAAIDTLTNKGAGNVIGGTRKLIAKTPAPREDCFDINEAIREMIVLTRGEALKNGVSVQMQLEGLPLVQGDRVQLQQVVLNLILNAVEAMSSVDGARRELSISTERRGADELLVTVRDSGPGIDPEHLERVFDSFYTTKPSGIGLGLSICHSIVEAHGGRLWATANEPRGAAFQFTLPAGN
jgi:anti-sigma regulatory factor (Ser/Thr protein kinase)